MPASTLPRAEFLNHILTSSFAGQQAKRFQFADGEVGAVYTQRDAVTAGAPQAVILLVATFPPVFTEAGFHDFGIDYVERPVASAAEAQEWLAHFTRQQAEQFRASCRVH